MGVPHRSGRLERFLDRLLRRKDAIFLTGRGIAEWFTRPRANPGRRTV